MVDQKYQATLSLGGQNRTVWAVIFRHPFRQDRGKPGRRVRRSLGTTDKELAQKLVDQANILLSDSQWWSPAMREQAERIFAKEVVAAFYDDMVPPPRDGWMLRGSVIQMPLAEDGYARVLFLGTTGAGKTTLLRQLIGTGTKQEKFPSTSTAKTTTCDIEIITAESDQYEAVISFLPKDLIRQYVEECVVAAAVSYLEGERPEQTSRRFLEHTEQRFRLSYLLGTLSSGIDEEEVEEGEAADDFDPEPGLSTEDRARLVENLQGYLNRIQVLATAASARLEGSLNFSLQTANREDRDTFEELLEDSLRDEDDFHELLDDVMDDIESRFADLKGGDLTLGPGDWPELWSFHCSKDERTDFIRRVNRFSSNYALQFGSLLTPLVEGIRVRGPFSPTWNGSTQPKLVLMDGEGLGHAVSSTLSISTRVTKRYQLSDVILLVDNAQQPMLATPNAALRSIVSSGQQSKLVLAFTHFDQMRGPNLQNRADKEQHVLASLDQSISALGKEMGRGVETLLKKITPERSFFLSNLQEQIPTPPAKPSQRYTVDSLKRLMATVELLSAPPIPDSVTAVYDDANLVLSIQKAVVEFREPWRARLGIRSRSDIPPEHWTRVKALTRRLGDLGQDEYDTLRPVADFIACLQGHVRPFLDLPLRWDPSQGVTDEMKEHAIDQIAQEVSSRLHELAANRLMRDRVIKWKEAYAHRGFGSASERRRDVESIYGAAAPIPGEIADPPTNEFLKEIRVLLRNAIDSAGGKLEGLASL
jgi:energy-coupling factor transporter ATP-binding protein EcfA2